jgi:nicotinamide riboside kinase
LVKTFVITGPESSGKSTLSKLLARDCRASLVEEYAREYLQSLNRPYEFEDVIIMAKEQLRQEQETEAELIFLDTDLTVFSVWLKEKYNKEIDWIENHLKESKDKIYFLCDIDIEWEEDDLREHPVRDDRVRLLNEYKNLLEKYNLRYHIISGDIQTRLKKCKEIIDNSI